MENYGNVYLMEKSVSASLPKSMFNINCGSFTMFCMVVIIDTLQQKGLPPQKNC